MEGTPLVTSGTASDAGPSGVENPPKHRAPVVGKRQLVQENLIYKNQMDVFDSYQRPATQYFVAFIILLNFGVQCWKREFDPGCGWEDGPVKCQGQAVWDIWGWFFNIIFLVELLWNLAGSFGKPFLSDGWNYFDCVVVGLGVLDMTGVDLGKLKLLRMVRAFRIFRLFGRVAALKKIISSLFNAASGVVNAFVIVAIVMSIYAVLAVDLFGSAMCDENGNQLPEWQDVSFHGDNCFGMGYYGSFLTSLYTMFQILTGESWSEGCVWPLLDFYHGSNRIAELAVMGFFMSFVIITQFILANVVVTVLIDGMNAAVVTTRQDVDSEPEDRHGVLALLEKAGADLDGMKEKIDKDLEDAKEKVAAAIRAFHEAK